MIIYLTALTDVTGTGCRLTAYRNESSVEKFKLVGDIEVTDFIEKYKIVNSDLWCMCFPEYPVELMNKMLMDLEKNENITTYGYEIWRSLWYRMP